MATEADYYFCAGDLVNWGRGIDAMGEILKKRADKFSAYRVITNRSARSRISARASDCTIFMAGTSSWTVFDVIGLGYPNPMPFDTPGEYSEEESEQRLHAFDGLKPDDCRLPRAALANHAGPHHESAACRKKSMRDFLQREARRYFFCGHIHEAAGVAEKLGETSAMNVGNKGYLLDWTSRRSGVDSAHRQGAVCSWRFGGG